MNNLYNFVLSDCASDDYNSTSQFTDEKFLPMDIITSCTGFAFSQIVSLQGTFRTSTDLEIDGSDSCVETKLYLLPLTRYDHETYQNLSLFFFFLFLIFFSICRRVQLTSSRIPSTQEEMRSDIFIKNENDIVVGKALKDGVLFEPEFPIRKGVEFCFSLQGIEMDAPPGLDLKIIDLASVSE